MWAQVRSELLFRDEFVPALDGLDGFSHIFVLTWLDRVEDGGRALLRIRPSGDETSPEVGVFATRTAHRPNPVAVSIVPLEAIKGNVVTVAGLDVVNGTPRAGRQALRVLLRLRCRHHPQVGGVRAWP